MKVLLDTHALLWFRVFSDSGRCGGCLSQIPGVLQGLGLAKCLGFLNVVENSLTVPVGFGTMQGGICGGWGDGLVVWEGGAAG